jgi:predicted dinucleotide-binding enzyme
MNIAIIGAGNVGGTLGTVWARKGHSITFGVRNPSDTKIQKLLASAGGNATAATVAEAAAQAPVVLLATPWEAAQNAIAAAGNLANKILIDTTNPLIMSPEGLRQGLVIGHATSAAEQIKQWAPGAKVVKAFNTIGAQNMANPIFGAQKATMFICGDDAEAKASVTTLSDDLGFETMDVGSLEIARLLEPVGMLWIHISYGLGRGPDFGFKIVKR